jgi:RNA polymerase sigma-70 factor, ECF subfamily
MRKKFTSNCPRPVKALFHARNHPQPENKFRLRIVWTANHGGNRISSNREGIDMASSSPVQITEYLQRWNQGDENALDELIPYVYDHLKKMAHFQLLNERSGHTLQSGDLVHEAYLKLGRHPKVEWNNRLHYLAVAARAMRQVLVDYARKRNRNKGPGRYELMPLDEALVFAPEKSQHLLSLDEALNQFAREDARKARMVELRVFGGMQNGEIGEILGISANTVIKDWNYAKAKIMSLMRNGDSDERRAKKKNRIAVS